MTAGLRRAAVAALAFVVACGGGEEAASGGTGGGFDMRSVDFAPELGVDLDAMERRPSGLYVQSLEEGEGREAVERSPVYVHYTGWLPDGTQFDSSRDRGVFSFMLGTGQVIPAWDEGVKGMRPGGVRRLVVPPELAYGARGAGDDIPPNTPLVFEIEVTDVLPPAPTGGVSGADVPGTEPPETGN